MKYFQRKPYQRSDSTEVEISEEAFLAILQLHGYSIEHKEHRLVVQGTPLMEGVDYCYPLRKDGIVEGWIAARGG